MTNYSVKYSSSQPHISVFGYLRRSTHLDLLANLQPESSGMFDLEKQDGEEQFQFVSSKYTNTHCDVLSPDSSL